VKHLLRWGTVSLLILLTVTTILVLLVIAYVQITYGGNWGRGISPSEFAMPIISLIFLSTMVGLVTLVLTAAFWLIVISRATKFAAKRINLIRLSLILVPLWLALVFFVGRVVR